MNHFIATFFSQYGAVQFLKLAKKNHIPCRLAPVPRFLSSSCGTCAHFSGDGWDTGFVMKDLEIIYKVTDTGYEVIFQTDESSRMQ
ncbi:MAG: DUF3343 domain-containing protein [Sphaerochaeta sp.]|jgi:hypothetical protein|uniref:DUF3343 domain-containing protein n=1 Tax=Sphaerochaeta sp. TaxID=1972642 RepID=UPI003D0D129E